MTWIKICATTNLADAEAAVAAGADALGFIFAQSTRRIETEMAAQIISALPERVAKVGVFVNESPSSVAEVAHSVGLTGVQLHGDEPSAQLAEFRRALGSRMVIKTLQARELLAAANLLDGYLRCADSVDAVLIDSGIPSQRGGTGIPFDWSASLPLVSRIKDVVPVIIAGGLTSENVAEAVRTFEPWGVDVVSGVEREIGQKDESKLRAFVEAARGAASSDPAPNVPSDWSASKLSTR
jgi:phosphoribosylanthranilate isomerase